MTHVRIVIGDCSFDATGDDVTALVAAWRAKVIERETLRLERAVVEKRRAVEATQRALEGAVGAARYALEDAEADLGRWRARNGLTDATAEKEPTP